MAEKDPKETLWENVTKLMVKHYGKENDSRLSIDSGIPPTNMTRYKAGSTNMGLDKIAGLAAAFDLQPWQILVKDFSADDPPALAVKENSWPFRDIDPSRFYALDELQRAKIEGAVLSMVAQFENASQSGPPAAKVNTRVGRSGLSAGTQKDVQTTPDDLKRLRETTRDVPTHRIPNKGKARPGTDKKA